MENRNNRGGMRGPGMGRRPAEKSKDFKGTWMKIIRYCKRYLAVIVVALICAVAGTILTILGPDKLSDLTKVITEGIATGIDMERVKSIGLTLVAFYVGSAILSFGQQFIMATVTQNVTKQLRSDISVKINRLPMAYYNKTSTGDVLSRVTNDVDMISQSMNQSIGNLVSAVALFFGSLIMMFKTNVIMTLTAVIATMIGFGLMSLITSHSQKYFSRQQANLGALNGHIEEIYSGHTVVKAYNGEKNAKKVFDELNNNLRDSAFKAQSLSGLMQPLMAFIGNFGYVAVCVMGAVLTMKGYIGFEVIVAFMMYIRLFTQPLAQIAQATQSLQSAAAAGERVFAFLGAEEMSDESDKTEKLGKAEGYVDFEHVKFGYEDTDKIIIHDFSAKAKPGQKIAIVGPTGAGKTTLVNLLMRFHEIQKEVGITFVFVTHDQEEALSMSDTVVVMNEGTIQQIGTPIDIYNEPENRFVAGFIGESNIIEGVMIKDFLVAFDDFEFICVDKGFPENEPVDVVIRPEDIDIVQPDKAKLKGIVKSVTFKGVHYETIVTTKYRDYRIDTTDYFAVGLEVGLTFTPEDIHVMWQMGSY